MPEVEHSTQVTVPIGTVWNFVEDMGNWAPFLTGYQRHEVINRDESIWVVKGELGGLSRTAEFKVHVTEWREPELVTFTMEGIHEPVTGSGEFRAFDLSAGEKPTLVEQTKVPETGNLLSRLWSRLSRWLLRKATKSNENLAIQAANREPINGKTQIIFKLKVNAGGATGPVLNLLLTPMLQPVAEDLANKIAEAVEK